MDALLELADRWSVEASLLRGYGAAEAAAAAELHAAQLREAVSEVGREALSLAEAALGSGYSVEHLRHLVADGTIPNAGRKGSPRIRRSDLPVKPGYEPAALARVGAAIGRGLRVGS